MKVNFKAFILPVVIALLGFGVLWGPAQGAVAQAVTLPDAVQQNIQIIALVAVSWVLARVVSLIPFFAFLESYRVPLASAIGLAVINWVQAATPDAWSAVVVQALQLIFLLLGMFFGMARLKEQGYRAFQ